MRRINVWLIGEDSQGRAEFEVGWRHPGQDKEYQPRTFKQEKVELDGLALQEACREAKAWYSYVQVCDEVERQYSPDRLAIFGDSFWCNYHQAEETAFQQYLEHEDLFIPI